MKARPILFSGAMVRALLAGRKTQTRRLVTRPAIVPAEDPNHWAFGGGTRTVKGVRHYEFVSWPDDDGVTTWTPCPYGQAGDLLWVRETCWAEELSRPPAERAATTKERRAYGRTTVVELNESDGLDGVRYAADNQFTGIANTAEAGEAWTKLFHYRGRGEGGIGNQVPGIHMPRWANRLTLSVTEVRVERLQDISEADAAAEGVEPPASERDEHDWAICPQCGGTGLHGALGANLGVMEVDCVECDTHAKRYRHLWNHINGSGSWDANPWVWAVTFDVHQQNVDAYLAQRAA